MTVVKIAYIRKIKKIIMYEINKAITFKFS
jgi:hypothetical protein